MAGDASLEWSPPNGSPTQLWYVMREQGYRDAVADLGRNTELLAQLRQVEVVTWLHLRDGYAQGFNAGASDRRRGGPHDSDILSWRR